MKFLLAHNADINASDKLGQTPLHWAISQNHKDVVDLLLAGKAMTNIQDAAALGDLEKVKALISGNPDLVFSKDGGGETPLYYAAFYGHKDVVELLLAGKAEINAKDGNGQTPFHIATYEGHLEVAELLRQHGGHD